MRAIGMFLDGNAPEIRNTAGQQVRDDDFLVLLNSHHEEIAFKLPEDLNPGQWSMVLNTGKPDLAEDTEHPGADGKVTLMGRSFILLMRPAGLSGPAAGTAK